MQHPLPENVRSVKGTPNVKFLHRLLVQPSFVQFCLDVLAVEEVPEYQLILGERLHGDYQ
eukprot:1019149-Prorocentrum_lima.AAC.1